MDITTMLLVILSILITVHLYIRKRRYGRLADKIPGPFSFPFIGDMLSFDISSNAGLWKAVNDVCNKYYPIARAWMCTIAIFAVRHPDDFEILLTHKKTQEKAWVYDYLRPWLKSGLLISNGEKWHRRRKMLTPSFHFNILSKYIEITREQGECMIKRLQAYGKESIQDVMALIYPTSLNIICESAMGVALDKVDKEIVENYIEALHKLSSIVIYRLPRPYIQDWMLKLLPFLPMVRDQNKSLEIVHSFSTKVIKERKEYHKRTGYKYLQEMTDNEVQADDNNGYTGSKKRLAMLDILLEAERDGLIDEDGVKEEVDVFILGGQDTTSSAVTFALLLLAENKKAQEKARAEVELVFNECEGKWNINDLQKLHYLERCIKETLRLYPPANFMFRHVREEIQLKNGLLPAGADILCNIYALHRDSNFWPNPDQFDPDRFLPENVKHRHPFAYLPFSAGPRNCIGQKFAMPELKSLIGHILYYYYLEPIEPLSNISIIADLIMKPSKPVYLKFIKIHGKIEP